MKFLFGKFQEGRFAFGLLLLRVVTGTAFMFHGWPKIQHAFTWMGVHAAVPWYMQGLGAFAEFGGGLGLIVGLLTPIAAFGIMCNMIVALSMVHIPHGDPFVRMGPGPSWELAAVYLVIAIVIILFGPGKFSLDAKVFRK